MPVIECDASETRAIDCELWVDLISQRALEDRKAAIQAVDPEQWELLRLMFYGRATTRKRSTLSFIALSRGARLPEQYWFLRDPDKDVLLIAWGDCWEEDPEHPGAVRLKTYEPLRRVNLDSQSVEEAGDRFSNLDFS